MFIPDPNFSIPDTASRVKKIPDPGSASASKNLNMCNPKNCFYARDGKMSWDPGLDPDFFLYRISDPRVKQEPEPGSGTLHKTVKYKEGSGGSVQVIRYRPKNLWIHGIRNTATNEI
jgi:hypothetical protein